MLITGISCIFAEVSEWQTSKIQVLVWIIHVWVQVPFSALNGAKPNPVYFFKKVFAVVVNFARK